MEDISQDASKTLTNVLFLKPLTYDTKHHYVKVIHVCSYEASSPFEMGDENAFISICYL